jgi:hypothetical protein
MLHPLFCRLRLRNHCLNRLYRQEPVGLSATAIAVRPCALSLGAGLESTRPAVRQRAAQLTGDSHRRSVFDLADKNFSSRKIHLAGMISVQVGQDNLPHVEWIDAPFSQRTADFLVGRCLELHGQPKIEVRSRKVTWLRGRRVSPVSTMNAPSAISIRQG